MNAKKIIKILLCIVTLIAILSTAFVSYSMARYANVYTGTAGALNVAKWSIALTGKSGLTAVSGSNVTITPTITKNASNHNVADNKIAPGTNGELAQVTITNNSDVIAYYELEMKVTAYTSGSTTVNMPNQLKVTTSKSGGAASSTTAASSGNTTTKTVTFKGSIPISSNVTCKASWSWDWGTTTDIRNNDSSIGEAAKQYSNMKYNVSISKFTVVQQKPGDATGSLNG